MHSAPRSEQVAAEVRAELARNRQGAAELARHMDAPKTSIWRKVSGKSAFTLDELDQVASFFGITMTDLIARSESAA